MWGWRRCRQVDVSAAKWGRQAFNLLAQGSAADIMRGLLRVLPSALPPEAVVVHQEFDAVIVRCPIGCEAAVTTQLQATMEGIANLSVPLKVRVKSGPTLAAVS
jgi:DNA polymerase I-like protein with 3'-5' exonuclease and polymerase domains